MEYIPKILNHTNGEVVCIIDELTPGAQEIGVAERIGLCSVRLAPRVNSIRYVAIHRGARPPQKMYTISDCTHIRIQFRLYIALAVKVFRTRQAAYFLWR